MAQDRSPGGHRRTSIVMGAFRGRQLAALIRARGDSILTLADLFSIAAAAGWRRQAVEHAVDVLVAGLDGVRLEQDGWGRPCLVEEGPDAA